MLFKVYLIKIVNEMKLSVVILSMTTTMQLFEMTTNCINSICESEKDIELEIIIIESNENYLESRFQYPSFVEVIVPLETFNFHRFLNIGIKKSTGQYIALCNNDLLFQNNWFTEIEIIAKQNEKIMSFSPVEKCLAGSLEKNGDMGYEIGYKVMTHIKGWCLVVKKELFQKIGLLDETFDFYYADNDYAMTLKSNNILHALVLKSCVIHLEKQSSGKSTSKNSRLDLELLSNYDIPNYLYEEKYEWVLNNERNLSAFLKYHNKWGAPNFLYRKNRLADILIKNKLGFFNRFLLPLRF